MRARTTRTRRDTYVPIAPAPSRGWKPLTPWRVIARRGRGDAYVSSEVSAATYSEAKEIARRMLAAERWGVPSWETVDVREGDLAPYRQAK